MFKIIVAGDFAPRNRIETLIQKSDYGCLSEAKTIIQSVDYAIVNFESPVVEPNVEPLPKTGPNLRCSEKALECVAQAGFNCVTLANNHFRDYGQAGVESTINACCKYQIDFVGGGKNYVDAKKTLFKTFGDKELAIINVCENEWSIASDNYGGSNPLDIVSVCRSLHEAKQKSDYVLLIIHGGTEHYNLPTPRMKETYRFFIDNGADVIVNHHQHCYSGYELYHDKLIFYGIGNFCFDNNVVKKNELWERGYLVELCFSEKIDYHLYPYIQCDESNPAIQMIKETAEFEKTMERLNSIIADDTQLQYRFNQMAAKGVMIAKKLLIPYSSSFAQKIQSKGLLPSFVSESRLNKLLAYIQCESHRDILLYGLKHMNKPSNNR